MLQIIDDYVSLSPNLLNEDLALKIIKIITDSNSNSVRDLFDKNILPCIKCFGYSDNQINDLMLVFGEAYSNAIIHGNLAGNKDHYEIRNLTIPENLEHNKNKKVEINVSITNEFVLFSIKDEGKGFNYKKEPRLEDFLEHGRGRYMMNSFSDIVHYKEPGNELFFAKYKNN